MATSQADIETQDPTAQKESSDVGKWNQDVDAAYTDIICLVLCLITGLCDSSSYNAWSCFLGMQTGNSIFLGLGASNQPVNKPWGWLKSLTSIVCFFCGSFLFAQITRRVGARNRGILFCSFMVQAGFIIVATAIIQANLGIPHTPADMSLAGGPLFLELIPIGLLAFQSAGSIATSRALGYNEIPTVVLTSVYFDIASDPRIDDPVNKNVKRNRRIGSVAMLVIGAIVGGWLSRSSGGMQSALWMAAGLKICIALTWWVWKGVPSNGE